MVVNCDICVMEPTKGSFCPGDQVSGIIRYTMDTKLPLNRMIISLKGVGRLTLTKIEGSGRNVKETNFYNKEDYVDLHNIIDVKDQSEKHGNSFNFTLPENIPSSLGFSKVNDKYKVVCNIVYYIGIHFESAITINGNKRFSKIITVASKINPRLPMEPTAYVEKKKLFQIMKSNECNVTIKASIQNSVIDKGGKVQVFYEVSNDTNITVKAIETKLIAVYTVYPPDMCGVKFKDDIKDTDGKTGPIKSGSIFSTTLEIDLSPHLNSLEYSKFVSRDYAVVITAVLPLPHYNAVLEIPIQIGEILTNPDFRAVNENDLTDFPSQPPSYSETMGEVSDINFDNNNIICKSDPECSNENKSGELKEIKANLESTIYVNENTNDSENFTRS